MKGSFLLCFLLILAVALFYESQQNLRSVNYNNGGSFSSASSLSSSSQTSAMDSESSRQPLCQALSQAAMATDSSQTTPPPASLIWSQNLDRILLAARHPMDGGYQAKSFVHNLLLDLSPSYLQRGIKSRLHPRDLERFISILEARRLHPSTAPKLKVLVLGGSVAEGVGCGQSDKIKGRQCSWSSRLQDLVNNILGFDGVEVTNAANGGTSTAQALKLIRYWLFPDSVLPLGPDIIIHAFGANDSNLGSFRADSKDAVENEYSRVSYLIRQGFERLNEFAEEVYASRPCPDPPIVFYLDDYIGGHGQGAILGDVVYNMVMTRVASWHQSLAISSGDVVREFIYMDTENESIFSPKWQKKDGKYKENCHFGWGGHQMIALAWAYALLDSVVSYCEQLDWKPHYNVSQSLLKDKRKSVLPEQVQKLQTEHEQKYLIRPSLSADLRLETVSELWDKQLQQHKMTHEDCSNPELLAQKPCPFAWVSGQEGRTRFAGALQKYLQQYSQKNTGWKPENDMSQGWARKLGLVAQRNGAEVEYIVRNITQPIKTLTVNSIQSYGEKWKDSKVEITVTSLGGSASNKTNSKVHLDKVTILGTHDSKTSTTHTTTFDLEELPAIGSDVVLNVKLVGGNTFKIMGMMLCSR